MKTSTLPAAARFVKQVLFHDKASDLVVSDNDFGFYHERDVCDSLITDA
jgi:hypothetical protein